METEISPSLPIPELLGLIRHSFLESEFNQVQNILMEWEKNMKTELENLERDCDLWKEKVHLMENTKKYSKLNEQNLRLAEDLRLLRAREKRADERSQVVSLKYSKMVVEKNKTISELNAKINELTSSELDNERMIREYQDKINVLENRVLEMTKEKEDVRLEKLVVDEIMDDIGNFTDRMGKAEETIVDDMTDNFMSHGVRSTSRCSFSERGSCGLSKKDDENLVQSSGTKEDEADVIQTSPATLSLSHIPQEESNSDPIKETEALRESGFMNLVQPSSKEDVVDVNNANQVSPGRQSTYDSPQAESNGIALEEANKEIWESVSRGIVLGSNDRVPIAQIIVISDSDDENELAHPKSVQNPSSRQTNKRQTTDWKEASSMRSDPNIKRCRFGSDNDSLPIDEQKEKEGLESTATDSDGISCSDRAMEKLAEEICSALNRK